jgi:hypothetical protein
MKTIGFYGNRGMEVTTDQFREDYFVTIISHPNYNNGETIMVDFYNDFQTAIAMHSAWIHVLLSHPPDAILESCEEPGYLARDKREGSVKWRIKNRQGNPPTMSCEDAVKEEPAIPMPNGEPPIIMNTSFAKKYVPNAVPSTDSLRSNSLDQVEDLLTQASFMIYTGKFGNLKGANSMGILNDPYGLLLNAPGYTQNGETILVGSYQTRDELAAAFKSWMEIVDNGLPEQITEPSSGKIYTKGVLQ